MCFTISSVFRSPRAGPTGTRWERSAPAAGGREGTPSGGKALSFLLVCRPGRGMQDLGAGGPRRTVRLLPSGVPAPGHAARLHVGKEARPVAAGPRGRGRSGLRWGPGKNARARRTQKPLVTVAGPQKAGWRVPARGVSARTRDRDRWPDFTLRTQAPLYGQRALSPPGLAAFKHGKYQAK